MKKLGFLLLLALLSTSVDATAASNAASQRTDGCPDFSGTFQQMFWGRWIMKIWITQEGCQTYSARYVAATGTEFFRNFQFDGVTRAVGGDPVTGTVHYEWAAISEQGIRLGGHTLEKDQLVSSWKGSLTLDATGNLIDWMEEFDAKGKSLGPVRQVFQRW